jgi:hypothetical protein
MKLRPPSPALAISMIALVVALTGTAYAATVIKNSSQIANGAVQSGDIKDGSVQNVDIRKSTITETRLSAGLLKKIGGAAPTGASSVGPTTNAAIYEARRSSGPEAQPPYNGVKVASLTVPAGAYSITAKTVMTALTKPTDPLQGLVDKDAVVGGNCRLDAAGDADQSLTNVIISNRQTPATLVMQITRTVAGPSEFTLECSSGFPFRLSETSIIAVKGASIIRTDATPGVAK